MTLVIICFAVVAHTVPLVVIRSLGPLVHTHDSQSASISTSTSAGPVRRTPHLSPLGHRKQWYGQQNQTRVLPNFNTLRPRQYGRHFPDDIFKYIFLNENIRISIKISLKFVPKGSITNIPALVQIMAWRRPGASHYLNQWWIVYWHIYASLGLNELITIVCFLVSDNFIQKWPTRFGEISPYLKKNSATSTPFSTCAHANRVLIGSWEIEL